MTVVLAWFQPSIKRIDEFETNARVALLNSLSAVFNSSRKC